MLFVQLFEFMFRIMVSSKGYLFQAIISDRQVGVRFPSSIREKDYRECRDALTSHVREFVQKIMRVLKETAGRG